MYGDDDQEDGEHVDGSWSQYQAAGAGQPWLRQGTPPWHLWGNSQLVRATVQSSAAVQRVATPGQLVKINYGRPETWQWLFAAKLVAGPPATVAEFLQVEVAFDLTVGIGRSAIQMPPLGSNVFLDKAFEQYFFTWGGGASVLFPVNVQLWTTEVLAPNRQFRTNAPFPDQTGNAAAGSESASTISQIVAQDLQLNCRVIALAPPGAPHIGQQVTVEVAAQFAPMTHVRPDWQQHGAPPEVQFPGGEVPAR